MKQLLKVTVAISAMISMLCACSSTATAPSSVAPSSAAPEASAAPSVSASAPAELVKVNAAYHPGLGALCVPGIDSTQHFFAEQGLEVNWIQFTAGPPEIAAMISGDLQFGFIGHGAHTLCAQGQANVISLSHTTNSERIIVRTKSGIKDMQGLKGKKIVTQLGTSGEIVLDLALEKAGMTRSDVNVFAMDMPGAVSAFVAGQADAIACWDAHTVNIQKNVTDELTILAQSKDFADQMSFPASWVATPEYIEKNHDITVRFVRALHNIYDYRAKDMDETVRLSAEFGKLEQESIAATRDFDIYYSATQIKDMLANGDLLKIYQSQLDGFLKNKKVESGDVTKYIRTDIMQEALK